jgi:hypothetical protein
MMRYLHVTELLCAESVTEGLVWSDSPGERRGRRGWYILQIFLTSKMKINSSWWFLHILTIKEAVYCYKPDEPGFDSR